MSNACQSEQVSVLVIDDKRELADLYAAWLSDAYDATVAYSGETGLETMDESIDIVFLDRRMPTLSGDETLEKIRDRGYDCFVAMVTAVKPDFDIIEMAFDQYLEKPVSLNDLNQTVDRFRTWAEYDTSHQELFAYVEKRAILEDAKPADELVSNTEYQHLLDTIERLKVETTQSLDDLQEGTVTSILPTEGIR